MIGKRTGGKKNEREQRDACDGCNPAGKETGEEVVHSVADYDGSADIHQHWLDHIHNLERRERTMSIGDFEVGFLLGVVVSVVALVALALKSVGGERNEKESVSEREEDRDQVD